MDIIGQLYDRSAVFIIQQIASYLDVKSLESFEKVSLQWRDVMTFMDCETLWKRLVKQKIATSRVWETLAADQEHLFKQMGKKTLKLHQGVDRPMSYRKTYARLEFAVESVEVAWHTGGGHTQNSAAVASDVESIESYAIDVSGNDVVGYDVRINTFHVWNRRSLRIRRVFTAPPLYLPEESPLGRGIIYGLLGDTLVYSTSECRFVVCDLLTGQSSVCEPFVKIGNRFLVNCILMNNEYFCASVAVKKFDEEDDRRSARCDIYVWKIANRYPLVVDWTEGWQKHSTDIPAETFLLSCDCNYLVIQSSQTDVEFYEFRSMTNVENGKLKPATKKLGLSIKYNEGSTYHDGYVYYVSDGMLKVYGVEIDESWTMWQDKWWSESQSVFLRVSCDNLYVSSLDTIAGKVDGVFREKSLLTVFKWSIANMNCGSSRNGARRKYDSIVKTFVPTPFAIQINPLDITLLSINSEETRIVITRSSFLPCCNYCQDIRMVLFLCTRCESAFYCNRTCQEADWELYHRDICNERVLINRFQRSPFHKVRL